MSLILTTEDRDVPVSILFTTPHGGVAGFANTPTWHSSDTNIVTVTAADDGRTATVSAVSVGSAALLVEAKTTAQYSGQLEVVVIDHAAIASNLTHDMPPHSAIFRESESTYLLRLMESN